MISHQSPYGQIIKFTSEVYYNLSDDKLSEIEQNCANIDREIVVISGNLGVEDISIEDQIEDL